MKLLFILLFLTVGLMLSSCGSKMDIKINTFIENDFKGPLIYVLAENSNINEYDLLGENHLFLINAVDGDVLNMKFSTKTKDSIVVLDPYDDVISSCNSLYYFGYNSYDTGTYCGSQRFDSYLYFYGDRDDLISFRDVYRTSFISYFEDVSFDWCRALKKD